MTSRTQFNSLKYLFAFSLTFAMLFATLGPVQAKENATETNSASRASVTELVGGQVLSDGQFVYGPNIGNFNLKNYIGASAPHLLQYADELYGRSEYFSINPKVYLTLLEIHSSAISSPESGIIENPLGLNDGDFISQIEYLSDKMSEAYYLHLYSYSSLLVSQRNLPSFITPSGVTINVTPGTNAGSYAIIAGLAAMDDQNISEILDNNQGYGFYQTYFRLFGDDDPLDEGNQIDMLGNPGAFDTSAESALASSAKVAPDNLLQLPYLQGLSWVFGGVHNTSGATTFSDASSLDFFPSNSAWGIDTSNMWVVAAASGVPTRISNCYFKVSHSGTVNVGWETSYYHLEDVKYFAGSINKNDKIGVIANTLAEATCSGGSSTGPHVHFSLKYNGAFVSINGTPLSGWYVHSGQYSYDTDPNFMWLEKDGVKKYAYNDLLLSEATSAVPSSLKVQDTIGVFRPSDGLLYLKNTNADGFADVAINYGAAGDYPVAGDWDGNGTYTIGVYRNGSFYLRNSNAGGFADMVFAFGIVGDQPIAGDWDGDGVDSIGIFRPSTGQFLLSNSNSAGEPGASFFLGNVGDVGIAGDWNGDGIDTTGVFRPSNGVLFMKNTNTSGFADIAINYGIPGDQPITGDWDNDGVDTIGVYRNGRFLLRNSNTLGFADLVIGLGNSGDMPISGDWDGLP